MKSGIFPKIKNIIAFVVFMVVICLVFCKVTWLVRGNDSDARSTIYGFDQEDDLDVVLFGGSDLIRFFDPIQAYQEQGFTSYDYGTSAGNVFLEKAYLRESLSTQRAQLYVFNIRGIIFSPDGKTEEQPVRNWSDSLEVFSVPRLQGITEYLHGKDLENEDVPAYYLDIIKYHSSTEKLARPAQWEYLKKSNMYSMLKGFHPYTETVRFERPKNTDERTELTEGQKAALIDLMDYCDSKKINALFIVCPYKTSPEDKAKYNTAGDIIRDRGYDYINFTDHYDEIGIDFDTDYADTSHVNYHGAEKYTTYLAGYLAENYSLPDHRGDEAYARWEECREVWHEYREGWESAMQEKIKDQETE